MQSWLTVEMIKCSNEWANLLFCSRKHNQTIINTIIHPVLHPRDCCFQVLFALVEIQYLIEIQGPRWAPKTKNTPLPVYGRHYQPTKVPKAPSIHPFRCTPPSPTNEPLIGLVVPKNTGLTRAKKSEGGRPTVDCWIIASRHVSLQIKQHHFRPPPPNWRGLGEFSWASFFSLAQIRNKKLAKRKRTPPHKSGDW